MNVRRILLVACVVLLLGAAPEYRMDHYRAPTPETLPGATVLTTEQARALWESRAASFIDVLPQPPRPPNLPAGTIWRQTPRFDIPGSIWLPDTGYGALAPVMETYFEHGLAQASSGDRNHLLVFYCLKDCWMSWNAAKRALSLGYAHVAWYPDGTDGWQASDLPTEVREPIPRPSVTE
jgi:PQQ-dependent catabolism-associated CXXCW motif protein